MRKPQFLRSRLWTVWTICRVYFVLDFILWVVTYVFEWGFPGGPADTPRDTKVFRLEQQGVKVHHAFNQYNIVLSILLLMALMATFMISVFSLALGLQHRRENYSKPAEHVKLDKDLAVNNEDWRPAYLRQYRQSGCVKGQYVAHILGSSLLIMLHVWVYLDPPNSKHPWPTYHLFAAMAAIAAILCDSASFITYRTQCAAVQSWILLLKQTMKDNRSAVAQVRDGQDVDEHEMDDLTDTLLDEPSIACTRFSNRKSHSAHYRLRESGQVICIDCQGLERCFEACAAITRHRDLALNLQPPVVIKPSFQDLELSATQGCHSCQVWRKALINECCSADETLDLTGSDGPGYSTPVLFHSLRYIGDPIVYGCDTYEMSLHCRRTCTILMYDPSRRMQPPRESTESFISPCSIDPCDYGIEDRSIQGNVNHPSVIQRVKFWLRECSEDHNTCPRARPENIPKRLLDLRHGQVRLVDDPPAADDLTWMALSYCWGPDQRIKLTKSTFAEFERGIETAILPATIRDAIDVARELNISHLWVDVLCIIQDDNGTDWKAHAGMMHHIYGEAKLTLCACSALSSTEGFRSDQEASSVSRRLAQQFPVNYELASLAGYLPSIAAHSLGTVRDRSPSNKRGWIFQEEILSPRILYWSEHGIYWSCYKGVRAENEAMSRTTGTQNSPRIGGIPAASGRKLILDRRDFLSAPQDGDWAEMVSAYSVRTFTRQTDRLPALLGLAALFERSRGGQYLHTVGLWKNRLPQQLLWTVSNPDESQDILGRKFGLHIASSWSWASMRPEFGIKIYEDRSAEAQVGEIVVEQDRTTIALTGRLRPLLQGMQHARDWHSRSSPESLPAGRTVNGNSYHVDATGYRLTINHRIDFPICVDLDECFHTENPDPENMAAFEINATRFLVLSAPSTGGHRRRIGCSGSHADMTYFKHATRQEVILV